MDEGLKEAYEEAEMFNWSKEVLMSYTVASMREQDARGELEKAKDDGREEGREEGIKNVARNSLVEGASVLFVSKITGLSVDEVKKIADELTKK